MTRTRPPPVIMTGARPRAAADCGPGRLRPRVGDGTVASPSQLLSASRTRGPSSAISRARKPTVPMRALSRSPAALEVTSPAGGLGGVTAARSESCGEAGEDVAGAGGPESDSSTGGCPPASVRRGDLTVERHDCTSRPRGRGRLTAYLVVAGRSGAMVRTSCALGVSMSRPCRGPSRDPIVGSAAMLSASSTTIVCAETWSRS